MTGQFHTAICFGEILWDVLPDGAQPGGAPMNVAYHLNQSGIAAGVLSKKGNDADGERLIRFLDGHHVNTALVQTDPVYPTGKVLATPGENYEMQYDIVFPVAWDFIDDRDMAAEKVAAAELFIFGSLAARNEHSRKTLFNLLSGANKKIMDINLRPPHFTQELIEALLNEATVLKLNENELELLSGWYTFTGSVREQAEALGKRFSIRDIIITRGAGGAAYYTDGAFYEHPGIRVNVVDTVGSGDAFLAGFLSQLQKGGSPEAALDFACRLGAFIATQKGACPEYDPAKI
ncbi:carbohydrate kinase family protein [Niabella drilacis]|uniref:Fructokinase n=1 Tax=Niabella drilacis (strain DSM 25811 / CCM 8410 / CCUG 62505 / LMG 26954 / E90) TaxID=1285928 RepID=A0A1G7APW8_NIADE|nr:carbohydrate kinase [Niabella drilacis]SDE16055.1 fructokinase [Niabella drilacis]